MFQLAVMIGVFSFPSWKIAVSYTRIKYGEEEYLFLRQVISSQVRVDRHFEVNLKARMLRKICGRQPLRLSLFRRRVSDGDFHRRGPLCFPISEAVDHGTATHITSTSMNQTGTRHDIASFGNAKKDSS